MIEFSINIDKEKEIKEFLSNNDLAFVSVIAMSHGVYFVCDSTEIYTHISFPIISKNNFKDNLIFRVPRNKIIALLCDGILKFSVTDEQVKLKFMDKEYKPKYSFKCKFQADLLGSFLRKLQILEEAEEYAQIDLNEIGILTRFAKSLNTNVKCKKDTACVELKGGTIYKKINNMTFNCSGKLLSLLNRYTAKAYNVQNYLVYKSLDKAIIVTKHRDDFNSELEFIAQQKALYLAEFSLVNIIDITKRIQFKEGYFVLDLNNQRAEYIEDTSSYEISVDVSNVVDVRNETRANKSIDDMNLEALLLDENLSLDTEKVGANLPSIVVPSDTLKSVLSHMGAKNSVKINIKKNFIILKVQGVFIVFGRRDFTHV